MTRRQLGDVNIWLLLGAGISVLAWAAPDKGAPWQSFESEWLAAVGLLPLLFWLGLQRRQGPLPVPAPAVAALALACVPVMQGLSGQIRFSGDAVLAVLYLAGAALAIVSGRAWQASSPESVSVGIPLAVLSAALMTLGLALMQWLHIDLLGVMLLALPPHARPTGNIGQANHFGTLMAWGLVGLWWLFECQRIGRSVAVATALLLLFGVAMSQSRTGWLHVAVLATSALLLRAQLQLRITPMATICLSVVFVAMVVSWSHVNSAMQMSAALSLDQQAHVGPRWRIWQQMVQAVFGAPWLGYGWTQVGLAQQAVLFDQPPLNIVVSHAHNLVLDLTLWQGVPLTVVVLLVSASWAWRRAHRIQTTNAAMCALALVLLFVHSMLEFPYQYAYFLLPAALLVGVIEADTGKPPRWSVPRGAWLLVSGLCVGMLLWLGSDYLAMRDSLLRYRFESARVGVERGSRAPDTHLLTQLGALMQYIRIPQDARLSGVELRQAQDVVERFPSAGNQFRLASLWAHNDHPERAALVLRQLCAIQRDPNCVQALTAWRAQSEASAAMRAVLASLKPSSSN